MSEENKNTPASAAAPEETVPDLTLQDLAALKSCIDVAQSRGAYKTSEMVPVGSVASKLEKFLEFAAKQSQAAQAKENPPQATPNA